MHSLQNFLPPKFILDERLTDYDVAQEDFFVVLRHIRHTSTYSDHQGKLDVVKLARRLAATPAALTVPVLGM